MVQGASGNFTRALTCIPDLPQWIDTRGMLLSGRALVAAAADADLSAGVVVVVPEPALMSVVGRPPASTIRRSLASLAGDVNGLAVFSGL